eukprot:TRINITY_DN1274_c3_g1_i3.p1 TRINITY_DN1274_c3_g1~~TRINITY_DN1274_c3_g1_i3.p1  ORF type:complete len:228 (-),score=65.27 TRINITY_DN1274_c3_g1_i3:17-628(-)
MYSNLTKRIQRAKQCVSSIKVELVDLEPDERAAVELQMTKHKKKISGLTQELEYAKNTSSREDLMEGRGVDATTVTVDQQIEYGKKTQDKTLALAQDARRVAKQTVEVGVKTNAELLRQREQIERIDEVNDRIDADLTRADRQIKIFMRNMMTDKIILCLLLLVILGIIAVVVLSIVDPNGAGKDTNVPKELKPSGGVNFSPE